MVSNIAEPVGDSTDDGAASESLNLEQCLELLLGPKGDGSAFDSDQSRCWAWQEQGAALLPLVAPGSRPWGWWQYDAPEPPYPRESEIDYLARHGLLTDPERLRLDRARIQVRSQATRKP
jgi:hypothetical protein